MPLHRAVRQLPFVPTEAAASTNIAPKNNTGADSEAKDTALIFSDARLEALKEDDFVYLHVEASDEAGHEGNIALKIQTIEDLDSRAIAPIYEEIKNWDEPVAIAVLPDHPTPCKYRTHTADPVPFLIWYPGIIPDNVQTFDEIAATEGSYGLLKEDEFIKAFMQD